MGFYIEDEVLNHLVAIISETTGSPPPMAVGLDAGAAPLLTAIMEERKNYLEMQWVKGELTAILNSMQEGIIVADNTGMIRYVNPAFTRISGIEAEERIGKNIFDVSPTSPLARCLLNKQPRNGQRYRGTSGVDVIGNTNPIMVDGRMHGAVMVFQPLNDYVRLVEELKKSNSIIEGLYAKIGQITTTKFTFEHLIGQSRPFQLTVEMARKAAKTDSSLLIFGESGVGKEFYAQAIHNGSRRRGKPFITVNCASIPDELLEREFFGYEREYAGDCRARLGKLELAHGGTLFLDEVSHMSPYMQAKFHRFLHEMEFARQGGEEKVSVDVRVIAATNRNLVEMVKKGEFREDLYFRLNVVEILIPPLRQRKEDLPLLIDHLIQKFNARLGKRIKGIRDDAREALLDYSWPGNVRELENALERGMVAAEGESLTVKELGPYLGETRLWESHFPRGEILPLEKMEELLILEALNRYGYHLEGKRAAASALGISLATLYNKLKKINNPDKYFSS